MIPYAIHFEAVVLHLTRSQDRHIYQFIEIGSFVKPGIKAHARGYFKIAIEFQEQTARLGPAGLGVYATVYRIDVEQGFVDIAAAGIGLVGEVAVVKMQALVSFAVYPPARAGNFVQVKLIAIGIACGYPHHIAGEIAQLIAAWSPVGQPNIGKFGARIAFENGQHAQVAGPLGVGSQVVMCHEGKIAILHGQRKPVGHLLAAFEKQKGSIHSQRRVVLLGRSCWLPAEPRQNKDYQ